MHEGKSLWHLRRWPRYVSEEQNRLCFRSGLFHFLPLSFFLGFLLFAALVLLAVLLLLGFSPLTNGCMESGFTWFIGK